MSAAWGAPTPGAISSLRALPQTTTTTTTTSLEREQKLKDVHAKNNIVRIIEIIYDFLLYKLERVGDKLVITVVPR